MTSENKPKRFALLTRVASSRITTVIAVVAAVAVLTSGTLLAFSKFAPPATDYGYDRAPSAFPTTIAPLGSPALTRGQTMAIGLQSISDAAIRSIELWEGDALYLRITEVETAKVDDAVIADLTLDYAPLLAGVHVIMARVTNDDGQVSQSDPLTVAVLDNPIDTGTISSYAVGDPAVTAATTVTIHTVPGDSTASIAARLGTTPDLVSIPDAGITGSFGASRAVESDFAAGSIAFAPLISQATAHTIENFGYAPTTDERISASVANCTVTVTAKTEQLAVYASTPMHAGFARIGDVAPGAPFVSNALPIGPSTIIAFKPGTASSDVSGANAPTDPQSVIVPDDCASAGWTGNARVVNGILLTDQPVVQPYAFVSVDGTAWKRVPEQQGTFLTSGSLNDVRSSLAIDRYDQIDVRVWSYSDGVATEAATGSFCRADMPNPDPSHSSGTGSECQPPGQIPGQDTDAAANQLFLSATTPGPGATVSQSIILPGGPTDAVVRGLNADTNVTTSIDLTVKAPVELTVNAYKPEFNRVVVQFSYYPISPATTTLKPPGVFYSTELGLDTLPKEQNEPGLPRRQAKLTIDPWQWRDAKIGDLTSENFATDGGTLALEDEIAANLALENLQNDKNVVDTIYVRVVAAQGQYYANSIPAGFATQSVKISMVDVTTYGTLPNPSASIIPGIDTTAPDTATRNKCFNVQSLPEANTWAANPYFAPKYSTILGVNTQTQAGDQFYSDRAMADRYWDVGTTYCLDPNADEKRAQAAASAEDDCSWFCIFTSIVVGAAIGLLAGGPAGALIGAMAGAAVALGAGPIIAEYYALLKALWDEIAKAYNTIYDTVNTLLAKFNPICLQAGLVSKDAKEACVAIAKSVQSAVITSVTGLPPQLPTSDVLENIAEGKLQQALEAGIDLALGQIGLSCENFEIDSAGETGLTKLSDNVGNADTQNVLNAARTDDGKLSGCHALAGLVTSTVRNKLTSFYGNQVSSLMEAYYVPGTVMVPVGDTSPVLAVTAEIAKSGPFMTTCPVTANIVAVMPYLWYGTSKQILTEFSFKPITSTLKPKFVGPGFTFAYYAEIPVPLTPGLDRGINPDLMIAGGQKVATAAAPYFTATIDSPCFDSTLLIRGYRDGSGTPAYVADQRPVAYYY